MERRVAIHVHGNLPDPLRPVVGNGLRAYQLGTALRREGFRVSYLTSGLFYRDAPTPPDMTLFQDEREFRRLAGDPVVQMLVCVQGEGLEWLPETGFPVPVVADWIAPRLLEFSFQGLPLELWLPRFLANVRKADYHLCCTDAQLAYLTGFLQVAGILPDPSRVAVLPLSATPDFAPRTPHGGAPVFVVGGISWPWIRNGRFLRILVDEMELAGRGLLKIFGGTYPFSLDSDVYAQAEDGLHGSPRVLHMPLMPYHLLQAEYLAADAAVDLFEENAERRLALSFREIDYLKAGLPMVIAPFSHMSRFVLQHGAGWVPDDLEDRTIRDLFRTLLGMPSLPSSASDGARDILVRHFNAEKTIAPLLEFLKAPEKAIPPPALFQSALLWAEQGRMESDRLSAEARSMRVSLQEAGSEVERLRRESESLRELAHRREVDLAATSGTLSEMRGYVSAKDADFAACMGLLAEKDRTVYLASEIEKSKEHLRCQGEENARLKDFADSEVSKRDAHIATLESESAAVREYVRDKEAGIAECVRLIAEKDSALSWYAGECARLVAEKDAALSLCAAEKKRVEDGLLKENGEKLALEAEKHLLEKERAALSQRIERLEKDCQSLAEDLREIRSKVGYKIFKRIFRK